MSQWVKVIKLLRLRDNYDPKTIAVFFKWFERHWRDQYVPIVYTSSDLRQKFPRLLAAMKRDWDRNGVPSYAEKPAVETVIINGKKVRRYVK